jgi:hypothetical protein
VPQETVMSLLAESCARKADEEGRTEDAAAWRSKAQGYRWTPKPAKSSQGPAQPRQRTPRPTPGRYMTEAQRSYLHDLIASRPPAEQAALHAALNAEWCARTLTVGRASSWISHLLQTQSVMVQPELISSGS